MEEEVKKEEEKTIEDKNREEMDKRQPKKGMYIRRDTAQFDSDYIL